MATMIAGDLEGGGPSQPLPPVNHHRLHGAGGADALQQIGQLWPSGGGNDDRRRLGGRRSLAAVAGRKPSSLHGADGADALQQIGQLWPPAGGNDDRRRLGGLISVSELFMAERSGPA